MSSFDKLKEAFAHELDGFHEKSSSISFNINLGTREVPNPAWPGATMKEHSGQKIMVIVVKQGDKIPDEIQNHLKKLAESLV